MGRPTDLTPEVQDKIVKALRAGNHFSKACEYAGVPEATGKQWLARGNGAEWTTKAGRPPLPIYVDFVDACKKAQADAIVGAVQRVMKAAFGGDEVKTKEITRPDGSKVVEKTVTSPEWQAAAWWLERNYPELYGRKDEVRIAAKVEEELHAALEAIRGVLPPEQYERVLDVLVGEDRPPAA